MKRQLLREHHNRQEKAWKEPSGRSGSPSRKGKPTRVFEREFECEVLPSGQIKYNFRIRYNEKIDKAQQKEKLKEKFFAALSPMCFLINGFRFKFTHKVQEFAKLNQFPVDQANEIFPSISELANGKLEIIERRFARAPVEFKKELSPDGKNVEEYARVHIEWKDVLQPE
jgi:hypothetical protein